MRIGASFTYVVTGEVIQIRIQKTATHLLYVKETTKNLSNVYPTSTHLLDNAPLT